MDESEAKNANERQPDAGAKDHGDSGGVATAVELTEEERKLVGEVGVDESVLRIIKETLQGALIKGDASALNLGSYLEEQEPLSADGISVHVQAKRAYDLLDRLNEKLSGKSVVAFINNKSFTDNWEGIYEIITLSERSGYQFIIQKGTEAVNYGLDTKDIVRQLLKWDEEFGIDVLGACVDWVDVRFKRLPEDLMELVDEIWKFCPDSIAIGQYEKGRLSEAFEELSPLLRSKAIVPLWWD